MPAKKGNNYAKGNKGGGRKTVYKAEYAALAYNYGMLGATDQQLAGFFEVSEQTINMWKKKHKEFSLSLTRAKAEADATVAKSLFHRANGYSHPDVDIKMYEGQIIKTDLIKHYPPDTNAGVFWLKNRQPKLWRDKHDIEHIQFDKMTDGQLDEALNVLKNIAVKQKK